MLVRKNWSVPTFRTAFWLLSVAMRGLDSTWTDPCDSRKVSNAEKFLVWKASPSKDAAGFVKLIRFWPADAPKTGLPIVSEPTGPVIEVAPVKFPGLLSSKVPVDT